MAETTDYRVLFLLVVVMTSVPPLPLRALQILAKSKLERCDQSSDTQQLQCNEKLVLQVAVSSDSSGREASIVAQIVETENTSSGKVQTVKESPVITIQKSAVYAVYDIAYIQDVAYRPEELFVHTRKCEREAGSDIVGVCARLRDENGHINEHTQPICCPCGPNARKPHKCGSAFTAIIKGKANTAHCLRFPGDWFQVFGVGKQSLSFSIRVKVDTQSRKSEVVLGPDKKMVTSSDNFFKANLVGDYVGYSSIPSFESFYLVTPRKGKPGGPDILGGNYSKWMLLERVRFTLDGQECNKIGVSYEAFNSQPDFCHSPFGSCLHNQLWNFWESDVNRIRRGQSPQYMVEKRFERVNQHPGAGSHSFSIGIKEALSTNLLLELNADDIKYVVHRCSGDILNISIPTFEALAQFGTATVTSKNTGELEASYSLMFDCSGGINRMEGRMVSKSDVLYVLICQLGSKKINFNPHLNFLKLSLDPLFSEEMEQIFIMGPGETVGRTFKLVPTTDKATTYDCKAVLKDADFKEVDRAKCQFTTTGTIFDTGTQIPFEINSDANSFIGKVKSMWHSIWDNLVGFFTGKTCRRNCSGFFDFGCHMQYICLSWIVMFGLFLAIFPVVVVLLWLLHQKGFFDPLYDWWDDLMGSQDPKNRREKHRKRALRRDIYKMHKHHQSKHTNGTRHHANASQQQNGRNDFWYAKEINPPHHKQKTARSHHQLDTHRGGHYDDRAAEHKSRHRRQDDHHDHHVCRKGRKHGSYNT